jgi:hypothetical protein
VYRRGLRTLLQDGGFTLVVVASSVASKLTADWVEAAGYHVLFRALAVFAVASLIWVPWGLPYLRGAWGKVRARFGG